jgi:tetratricopeptide (TPR) repeat protein
MNHVEPTSVQAEVEGFRHLPQFGAKLFHPSIICLLLAIITLLVFWPVHRFEYVNYDDRDYVTANKHVETGLNVQNIIWAFRESHSANWHPLTWLSHMVDVSVFGKNPGPAHLVNLAFHITNTLLLFILLRRLTQLTWAGTLVAALFALHPLHVESVAWIAERKDVLSGMFFMLTLLSYGNYAKSADSQLILGKDDAPGAPRHFYQLSRTLAGSIFRNGWYTLSLLCFGFGLMSKPMLVTLPFVLLLLDFWPLQRFAGASTPSRRALLVLEKFPFFVLSAGSALVTFLVQRQGGAIASLARSPLPARLANALVSYARYLEKTIWPTNLATPYPPGRHWPLGIVFAAGLLLLVLSLVSWKMRTKRPYITVGWFWFIGTLVPVIGLIQVGEQAMADRYMYLPSLGLFIMLAWALQEISAQLSLPALLNVSIAALAFLGLSLRTRNQLVHWQNSETLFRHTITVSPNNWVAHYNLANYLDDAGHFDEAIKNYLMALEIDPGNRDPLNNIGWDLAAKGDYYGAITYFQKALQAQPNFFQAHYNIGKAYEKLGKLNEASEHYRQVLVARPDHVEALNSLASAMSSRAAFSESLPFYEASLKVNPKAPLIQYDYANALAKVGRTDEAIEHYRATIHLKPDHAQAYNDLGIALARKGRIDEAIAQLRLAVKHKPNDPSFLCNLGKLLFSQHKTDEAIQLYRQAIKNNSEYVDAHNALGSALAMNGNLDDAILQFENAARLQPNNPATHFNLGRAFADKGKTQDAIDQFKEALRLNPNFAPAKQAIRALEDKSVH